MNHVEDITDGDDVLALIVRAGADPADTTFITDPAENFQVGFIVKKPGQDVPPHRHHPIERLLTGTSEVLLVREGRCELDIFSKNGDLLSTSTLTRGDVAILLRGGHGIRVSESTVFLEVKQGPYPGTDEKEHL